MPSRSSALRTFSVSSIPGALYHAPGPGPGIDMGHDLGRVPAARRIPGTPVHRGWSEEAELAEVIVLGDEGHAVARSILPQVQVGLPLESDKFDVFALGIRSFESTDQLGTEVLIEQQAHAVGEPASRRSRAAAKAKAAPISSRVKEGKSARISASVIGDVPAPV